MGRPAARGSRREAGGWGFDGLELACWGDHFEVDKAPADEGYCRSQHEIWNAIT